MKKIIFLLFILIVLLARISYSASPGTVYGEFLRIGVNGRPAGMGEAFCAVADNANAVYWNPAGLTQLEKKEIQASHTNIVDKTNMGNFVYGQSITDVSAVGIEIDMLSSEQVRRNAGSQNAVGAFTNAYSYISVAYAYAPNEVMSVGAGIKSMSLSLDNVSTSGLAIDVGILYRISKNMTAGAAIQNVGKMIPFENDPAAPLSTNIKAGIACNLSDKLLTACDINIPVYGTTSLGIGTEYLLSNLVTIRGGYKLRDGGNDRGGADGLSLGLGINVSNFSLDYAFVPFGYYETMNKVSLSMRF